jgi:hypothetical protein
MLNDTVDILDAHIVNIGLDFQIVAADSKNKFAVVEECLRVLRNKYSVHNYIGEPFYVSDVYTTLNKIDGVVDVLRVRLEQKTGSNYSSTDFDLDAQTSADGRYISVPDNVILEFKYLTNDIKGSVK